MGDSIVQRDVIIVGGGAAGLMCALTAGQRGKSVLLLDRAPLVGKKILISGGGRCNFTNLRVSPENYLSQNRHFCKSALSRFTPEDFIAMVEAQGIRYFEKTLGQLFCSGRSREILDLLLKACRIAQVEIKTSCRIENVEKQPLFKLKTSLGEFQCASLVIASGGLSYPKIGASGFGYQIAKQFGLDVVPCRPALVSLNLNGPDLKKIEGLSGTATGVSVSCNGTTFKESMLMTHKGLSGPAILQISNYWHPGEQITIDWLPEIDLNEKMDDWRRRRPTVTLKVLLSEHMTKRLAGQWLAGVAENKAVNQYGHKDIKAISEHFQNWAFIPSGTGGYRIAEVTVGGVNTDGLSSKSFESKSVSGLYFIGEVLDVTGWLGGYNFQWSWSSGHCAGLSV